MHLPAQYCGNESWMYVYGLLAILTSTPPFALPPVFLPLRAPLPTREMMTVNGLFDFLSPQLSHLFYYWRAVDV